MRIDRESVQGCVIWGEEPGQSERLGAGRSQGHGSSPQGAARRAARAGGRPAGITSAPRRTAAGPFLLAILLAAAGPAAAQNIGNPVRDGIAPPPGSPAVDPALGLATVMFPFEVPPGRHGMEPTIALRYVSAAGPGNAGYGFNLTLGMVERTTRLGPPRFDNSDLFTLTLDGQTHDLVPLDADSTRFRTAIDTGFLVERRAPGPYGPGSTYWVARGRDGRFYRFGFFGDPASEITQVRDFKWGLDRVEDVSGNVMDIRYAVHGQMLYPARLTYASHPETGLPAANAVHFCWEGRGDVLRTPARETLAYRLQSVTTWASGQQARAWRFEYSTAGDTSNLVGGCAAPLTGQPPPEDGGSTDPDPGGGGGGGGGTRRPRESSLTTRPSPVLPADGTAGPTGDAVSTGATPAYCTWDDPTCPLDSLLVGIGRTGGASHALPPIEYSWWTSIGFAWDAPESTFHPPAPFVTGELRDVDRGVRVEDLNRDGRPDVIQMFAHVTSRDITVTRGVWLNTGSGFALDAAWTDSLLNLIDPEDSSRSVFFAWKRGDRDSVDLGTRFLDVNDDGLPDIVRLARHYEQGLRKRVFLNTGAGFTTDVSALYPLPDEPFVTVWGGPSRDISEDLGVRIADVNGDGRADLLMARAEWSGSTTARVYLYDRGAYRFDPGWVLPDEPFVRKVRDGHWVDVGLRLVELNRDGLVDLFVAANVNGFLRTRAYLNTGWPGGPGPTWAASDADWSLPGQERFVDVSSSGEGVVIDRGLRVADIDPDGRSDIVMARTWEGTTQRLFFRANPLGGWVMSGGTSFPGVFIVKDKDQPPRDTGVRLVDFDGDGGLDYVQSSGSSTRDWRRKIGWHGRSLLGSFANGLGGRTSLVYAPAPRGGAVEGGGPGALPFPMAVVAERREDDGMGTVSVTRYAYSGPFHHHRRRDFRGFREATIVEAGGESSVETLFHQQPALEAAPLRGAPERRVERRVADGAVFSVATWTYDTSDQAAPLAHPPVREETALYEWTVTDPDGAVPLARSATSWSYVFDDSGPAADRRLVRRVERREGDPADPADDRFVEEEFRFALDPGAAGGPAAGRWFLDVPVHRLLRAADGTVLSESWMAYDDLPYGELGPRALPTREERRGGPQGPAGGRLPGDPGNAVVRRVYDATGNLVEEIDPLGRSRRIDYDATRTFPERTTDPLGRVTVRLFDPRTGVIRSVTDPNARTLRFDHDGFGRRLAEYGPEDPAGRPAVAFRYDDFARPARVVRWAREKTGEGDAAGTNGCIETLAFFDGRGRLLQTKTEAPDGLMIVTGAVAHDAAGRVAIEAEPFAVPGGPDYVPLEAAPHLRRHEYDAAGRRTALVDAGGARWRVEYGARTTRFIDPLGHRRDLDHDAFGGLNAVREYEGTGADWSPAGWVQYEHDAAGRLAGVWDASGTAIRITYDALGRRTALDDPHSGSWRYEHDLRGNLVAETDPLGAVTRMTYDPLDRLVEKMFADGSRALWTWDEGGAAADALGRLTSISDATGVQRFAYDAQGRVTETSRALGDAVYSVRTSYDALGRATDLALPAGRTVRYEYDAGGNLSAALPYVSSLSHNERGQVVSTQLANGARIDRLYEPATGRPLALRAATADGTALLELGYGWLGDGLIDFIDERFAGEETRRQGFDYDGRHRLVRAAGPYGEHAYRYDDSGNLVERDGVGFLHEDFERRQRLTRTTRGESLAYDAGGRVTSVASEAGTRRFSYDAAGRPAGMSDGAIGVSVAWEHDAGGRCVREITERPGARSVVLSPLPQIEVRDGVLRLHIFAGDLRVAVDVVGDGVLFPIADHLGSPRLILDGAAEVVARHDFAPHGLRLPPADPRPLAHLFAGAREQKDTGLLQMGARIYDPALGRFLQPDPQIADLTRPQSLHRYAYARNDPVNLSDPGGRSPLPAILFIGALALLDKETRSEVGTSVFLTAASIFLTGSLGPGAQAGLQALRGSKAALYAAALTPVFLRSRLGETLIEGYAVLFQELGLSPRTAGAAAATFTSFLFNSHFQRSFAKHLAPRGDIHAGAPIGGSRDLDAYLAARGASVGPPSRDAYGVPLQGRLDPETLEFKGLDLRELAGPDGEVVGVFGTRDLAFSFQHGAAGFFDNPGVPSTPHRAYLVGGISTQQFARELFLAGYSGTLFTLTGRFSDFLIEFVYGPYGGGLAVGIHTGGSSRYRPSDDDSF